MKGVKEMKKSELEKIYEEVAEEIGFKEDLVAKGWMPKLGPDDYRCKIVHGFTKKGNVTLVVGPAGFVDFSMLELVDSYALKRKEQSTTRIVLPHVYDVGEHSDRSWVVRERVEGERPLSYFREFPDRREKIATLYWNTVKVFSSVTEEKLPAGQSVENFLRNRFDKWIELGNLCKGRVAQEKYNLFRTITEDVIRYVVYESDILESLDLEMELFFKNFGNTDMVCAGQRVYLPNSEIVLLSQFYGASYFVWNVLICNPNEDIERALATIDDWRGDFEYKCPKNLKDKFNTAFWVLLLERVLATLLVDIPLRRSPFDAKGKEARIKTKKAEKLFVEILMYFLNKIPTLVKNPFEADLKALNKFTTNARTRDPFIDWLGEMSRYY